MTSKKKKGYSCSHEGGLTHIIRRISDQDVKIRIDEIVSIARPESGIAIRFFLGDKDTPIYLDGGKLSVQRDAPRFVERFLERCAAQNVAVEPSTPCFALCYQFLLELGYAPFDSNMKELLFRAQAKIAAPVEKIVGSDGTIHYQGGIVQMWPDLGMELCPLFLHRYGIRRFRGKARDMDHQWNAHDTEEVIAFLLEQNVCPTPTNCDHLIAGMLIELLMPD